MTKMKSLFAALAFALISTATFANNDAPNESLNDLRAELTQQFEKISLDGLDEKQVSLDIKFLINDENELIVLSTSDKAFDRSIKSLLNYKKLDTTGVQKNMVISVPVTLKKY